MTALLEPYRVLDATGPLGYLTGKILGDLGADVVKVEPPGGDPSRKWPPLLSEGNRPAESLSWLAFNVNKREIQLDLETEEGRDRFRSLAQEADFLLETFPPGKLDDWGLGYDDLSVDNPGLILVSITPFGQDGPFCDFLASDLEIMALSGVMSLAGDEGAEPMRVTAPAAPMWVGAEAAIGALTALAYRSLTGRGQQVDVSAQVAAMAAVAHAPIYWDLNRVNPERTGIFMSGRTLTGARMRVMWPCQDGWLNFIIYGGPAGRHTNRELVAWMDERNMAPDWLKRMDWSTFTVPDLTQEEIDKLEAPIAAFFSTITKREFYERVMARSMLGYPVATAKEIHEDPQLEGRRFWQAVRIPGSDESLRFPGGFAMVNGKRLQIRVPKAENIGDEDLQALQVWERSSGKVVDD
jgi:crotonobetainyl-CoA:carnitine CoA-transferase CaiB-like acyl-CoA transferase